MQAYNHPAATPKEINVDTTIAKARAVVQVAEAKGFKRLFSDVPPNFN